MTERDAKKDFDEAYKQSIAHWQAFLTEAQYDLEFSLGKNPYGTAAQESYLKAQGREVLNFRKNHRVIKMITGYERRNRLSIKVDPVEGSDENTAAQFTGILLMLFSNTLTYNLISDAFEQGPIKTGVNLIDICIDYSDDPLSGDIVFRRKPYNRFLLDPATFSRDLSDCGWVLTREHLSGNALKSILPANKRGILNDIKPRGTDNKYMHATLPLGLDGKDLYKYDEFWVRDYEQYITLINPMTGKQIPWQGTRRQLEDVQIELVARGLPEMKELKQMRKTVKLHSFVEGEHVYSGPDILGIGDYPHVLSLGFFDPEVKESNLKIQSIARISRDPTIETNKRRSKLLDILDSQISSGWLAEEESVINNEALYQSGQAQVVWLKKGTMQLGAIQKINPADIPQGLFQLMDKMDSDVGESVGVTAELLGGPDDNDIEIAALLSKLRSSNSLTVLQDLFDNLRLTKQLIGQKTIKALQANYKPEKISRILNQPPSKEFYNKRFGKYDAIPVEGLLTDTQRQMFFTQLISLKKTGAPIPWSVIIDNAPIEKKDELKQAIIQQEKAMQQQGQAEQTLMMLQKLMAQAKIKSDVASSQTKLTQAEENRTNAMLDRARTVKELQGIDFDQMMKVLEFMKSISESQQLQNIETVGGMQ
jgi:hypothetical protein